MIIVREAKDKDLYRISEMTRNLTEHLWSFVWKVESCLIQSCLYSLEKIHLYVIETRMVNSDRITEYIRDGS